MRGVAPVLFFALVCCEGRATYSDFDIQHDVADGSATGLTTSTGSWTYGSWEVDVVVSLVTEREEGGCVTTASLSVDTATASPKRYGLVATDCSVLALTEAGDIVLYGSPTGHDWSTQPLRVDTDRELIVLGPWITPEPEATTYLFTIAAPACGHECSCPSLSRRHGSEDLVLDLGRDCD